MPDVTADTPEPSAPIALETLPPTDLETPVETPNDMLRNVVPFRPIGEAKFPVLTPVENNAFNELARQLSARLEKDDQPEAVNPPGELHAAAAAAPQTEGFEAVVEPPSWLAQPEPPARGEALRDKTLLEAIASSLTELFSPQIISERIEGMLKHYDFVNSETLAYFSQRPPQAERDSRFALDYVKANAVTAEAQRSVLAALEFKCDVLWAMLDALYHAYVAPGHIPPGAFVPQEKEPR